MPGTISIWIDRWRQGDSTAIEQLWAYFSPELTRRIAPECRQLTTCDEEDIVSIAFFRLTTAMLEEKADGITNRKEFWRLLSVIAQRRIRDSYRHQNAQRRGGDVKIISLHGIAFEPDADESGAAENGSCDSNELIGRLLNVAQGMHRPEFAKIIELKTQNKTNAEVARALGISLRTTQYLIREIKQMWCNEFREYE